MATEADVLVIFGITGDLARKMTFEALYKLECRGDLDCRVIGVARIQLGGQLADGALRDLAGGDHHPGGARLLELGDEVVERVTPGGALAGEGRDRVGVDVEDDTLVPVAH